MASIPLKDVYRFGRLCSRHRWSFPRLGSTSIHARSQSILERRKHACFLNNAHSCRSQQLHTFNKHANGTPATDSSVLLSPAVRYLVFTHNISDLSQLTPTGPGQRLLKGDVLKYMDDVKEGRVTQPAKQAPSKPAEPAKPAPTKKQSSAASQTSSQTFTDKPVDSDRIAAAQRVVQHKATTPYSYASVSCSLDKVFSLGYSGQDLTAFFVKVAALTIQRLPQSNCVWVDNDVRPLPSVCVSVLCDGRVVKVGGADAQSLAMTANTLRGESSATESSQASSISIVHLSEGDITHFTSIIDPAQSSTLSIGSPQLVPNEQGAPSRRVTVTLTADARVMDYELSCQWLETFGSMVEAPDTSGLV